MVIFFGSLSSAGFGFDQAWWASIMSSDKFTERFGTYSINANAWSLTPSQQSVGTGVGYVGVILGLLAASPVNEQLGRKKTMFLQTGVVTVGIIIESCTKDSFAQFLVGKAIVFFGGGIATNVIPVYQAEVAPPQLRGLMAGTYNAFLMIGGLFAALIVYLCRHIPSDWAWRAVVVAQIGIPFLGWIGLPFLPESPYWLVQQGRVIEAASALRRLRGHDFPAEAEVDRLHQQAVQQRNMEGQEGISWIDCIKHPVYLRRTIISFATQVFQQAQGISFVANYQAVFLSQIGFRQVLLLAVIIYVIGIVANIIGMLSSDRLGRRSTLLYSAGCLAAFMLVIGGLTTQGPSQMSYAMQLTAVAMLVLWFFMFQVTWGPLAWVITSEVPPSAVREKMVSLSGLAAYGTGLIIVFINPHVQDKIGGNVAFIYGGLSIVSFFFVYFLVPELRRRSLEDIDEMFNERLPVKAFSSYVCKNRTSKELEEPTTEAAHVDNLP
jgi:sugar porter (SP) family MFS transporter